MSKHTPGPWGYKSGLIMEAMYNGFTIANVKDASEVDRGRDEANGLLMAAAPELLEVAHVARGILEGIIVAIRKVDPQMALEEAQATTKYLRLINDAIAKAEGK